MNPSNPELDPWEDMVRGSSLIETPSRDSQKFVIGRCEQKQKHLDPTWGDDLKEQV